MFELKQVLQKLELKIVSAGFDPISKLSEIPNNPKKRYEVMTKDMPLGGSMSLDMICSCLVISDSNSVIEEVLIMVSVIVLISSIA